MQYLEAQRQIRSRFDLVAHMPIIGWLCSGCGGRQVPLDHFATTSCGERVHPDFARAVLADRNGQPTGIVRVSHGKGCPRAAAIEQSEDYYLDPLSVNAQLTGTAWHSLMETGVPANEHEQSEVRRYGVISGVSVSGKPDRRRLSQGEWIAEDYKHTSEYALKWKREAPNIEDVVQLSLYAEIDEQNRLPRPTRGIIWIHSSKSGADAWIPHQVKLLMPIGEALAVKPYGGSFTVGELLQQANEFFGDDAMGWRIMPLAGSTMSFGSKSMCDYCAVRDICTQAENGAPF